MSFPTVDFGPSRIIRNRRPPLPTPGMNTEQSWETEVVHVIEDGQHTAVLARNLSMGQQNPYKLFANHRHYAPGREPAWLTELANNHLGTDLEAAKEQVKAQFQSYHEKGNTLADTLSILSNHSPNAVDIDRLAETVLNGDATIPERWDALGALAEHHQAMADMLEQAIHLDQYKDTNLDQILQLTAPQFEELQAGMYRLSGYKAIGVVLEPVLSEAESAELKNQVQIEGKTVLETSIGKHYTLPLTIGMAVIQKQTDCTFTEAEDLVCSGKQILIQTEITQRQAQTYVDDLKDCYGLDAVAVEYTVRDGSLGLSEHIAPEVIATLPREQDQSSTDDSTHDHCEETAAPPREQAMMGMY